MDVDKKSLTKQESQIRFKAATSDTVVDHCVRQIIFFGGKQIDHVRLIHLSDRSRGTFDRASKMGKTSGWSSLAQIHTRPLPGRVPSSLQSDQSFAQENNFIVHKSFLIWSWDYPPQWARRHTSFLSHQRSLNEIMTVLIQQQIHANQQLSTELTEMQISQPFWCIALNVGQIWGPRNQNCPSPVTAVKVSFME